MNELGWEKNVYLGAQMSVSGIHACDNKIDTVSCVCTSHCPPILLS